ncbi:hypothetical protein KCU91_g2498, partial [Aureobasidium melanogenum]
MLLPLVLLASWTLAQSVAPALPSPSSCVKRSIIVYTSDSSTYFATNVGTSSFPSTPIFCPNASVSTVVTTQPGSTVTVYSQATSAQQSADSQTSIDPIITDNGFEDGTSSPFNSSSGSSVTAEVVKGGRYEPHAGNNYLLISFNETSAAPERVRRQSRGPSASLVYNMTQMFSASAGTSYTLTAWAAVTEPADKPYCWLTICGDNDCSLADPITTNYTRFSYDYQSPIDESGAIATFEVACDTSAYVALDDVSVTNNALAANASIASASAESTATITVSSTVTVLQSQIYTQFETTTFVSGSEIVLTTSLPTTIYQTVNKPVTETRTVSTILVSTQTATTAVPQVLNITVSSVSTSTTTLTTILNSIVVSYQPSSVVETQYATSTALVTTTQPGVTPPASTIYQEPSTAYVTLDPSTLVTTLEQPIVTVTPQPVTLTFTPDAQTSTLVSYLDITDTISITLPQETAYITPSPVTNYVTPTLEPETTTIYVSVTLPPLIETLQINVTPAAETQIQTFTVSPGVETLQLTTTLPQNTVTLSITQTLDITDYEPTVTEFYTPIYVPPPPSGVPAVALARPTAIVGDVNGAPSSVDDVAYSVSLPANLTMYNQSSANIRLLGLVDLNWEYTNYNLPYGGNTGYGTSYPTCLQQPQPRTDTNGNVYPNSCFGDVVAFGLWDDLFIYQGTQQGIYYEVDGVAPSRRTSFEFYISHFSDQNQYYHFLMNFYEDRPNFVHYQYLNVSDYGVSATVGVQMSSAGLYNQFSYNQAVVCPGMELTFDTTPGVNSLSVDNPGNCSAPATPQGNNDDEESAPISGDNSAPIGHVGTTILQANPTFCPNISTSTLTSTVFEPTLTITLHQPISSAPQSGSTVITNNGFENGTAIPFNTSASTASVSAEVVQGGPYQPRTGDDYLLITFNDTASPTHKPTFNSSSGIDYTVTAWAAETANGDGDPQCSITICGDDDCSSSFALTTSYQEYSFVYQSPIDETSAVATFQLECPQSGYVALDDVSITSDTDSSGGGQVVPTTTTTTIYQTETIVQSQTFTQVETTTSISGSEVIFTTLVPTIVYTTINDPPTIETTTVSSLLLSTAIATTAVPQYVNITVSSVSTVTTTLTSTLSSTVISYQPSLVVVTDVVVTLRQPVVTITPEPITQTSMLDAQTSMLVSVLNLTETVSTILPQETTYLTADASTQYVTFTLPPDTTTIFISVTPPPVTEIVSVSVTLPAETQTEIQSLTLPAETQTVQVTQSLPDVTETVPVTESSIITQYGPTITETYASSEPSTIVELIFKLIFKFIFIFVKLIFLLLLFLRSSNPNKHLQHPLHRPLRLPSRQLPNQLHNRLPSRKYRA